ncbi:hypothetical protein P9112_010782 [Eukaryota sp. TZLM1-RC]
MSLTDFNLTPDEFISRYDNTINSLYTSVNSEDQVNSQKLLVEFQQHPRAFERVPFIMEKSSADQGKYIALSVLEELVNYKWKALPPTDANALKLFLQNLIVQMSNAESPNELLLRKADKVLVDIAKQEWPEKWPTFVSELVQSARSSLGMAKNNLTILRLLTEEVTDFSDRSVLITARAQSLKSQLNREFSAVFELCLEVLSTENAVPELLTNTLIALEKYIPWISLSFIFQTELIPNLINNKLNSQLPLSIKTLIVRNISEVAELRKISPHEAQMSKAFANFLEALNSPATMPVTAPISQAIQTPGEARDFASATALALTAFLRNHSLCLENNPQSRDKIAISMQYLLHFTATPNDSELFKTCVEYWSRLSSDLYSNRVQSQIPRKKGMIHRNFKERYLLYSSYLDQARELLMDRMVKPEEVLITQNQDTGEWVKETLVDTEEVELHKKMKEALVFITHLNTEGTRASMDERLRLFLERASQTTELDADSLNRLCWVGGAISGSMPIQIEKKFVIGILKKLLDLCNKFFDKTPRAIVASNVMYICSQYPRFLRSQSSFLETVCRKLFEFMKETHPGIKDMACDTFIIISGRCKKKMTSLIDGYIQDFDQNTKELPFELKEKVVESYGLIISALPNTKEQQQRLDQFISPFNLVWRNLFHQGQASGGEAFNSMEVVASLNQFVRFNSVLCKNLGPVFSPQMSMIYKDLLSLYRHYSHILATYYSAQGSSVLRSTEVKAVRSLQKSILKLLTHFFETARKDELQRDFFSALLPDLLPSYEGSPSEVREPEVLGLLTVAFNRLPGIVSMDIFKSIVNPTLAMISNDYESWPDLRTAFFTMISAIVDRSLFEVINLGEDQLTLLIQTIIWASKHNISDQSELGLVALRNLVKKISHRNDFVNSFLSKYFIYIFHEIFAILTDTFHKSTFDKQVEVISNLISALLQSPSSLPIGTEPPQPAGMSNVEYFQLWISNVLKSGFPNLGQSHIAEFVKQLTSFAGDVSRLRSLLADFLVSTRQWTVEEFEVTTEAVEQQLLRQSVPGLGGAVQEDEF